MAKACGIEGCKKIPEFYCECKTNNYHCQKHFFSHMKNIGGNHISSALFISVDPDLKGKLIKGINSKCQLLEKAKIEMQKRCNEIIELTIQKYRNAIKKIKDDQRYFNLIKKVIIENSEIDKEEFESGNILSESLFDLEYNIESIRKEINSCFTCDFKATSEDVEDVECFWLNGTTLQKIDLNTYKKTQQNVQFSLASYNNSCRLPDNTYFVQNCSTPNSYSVDLKSNSVLQLPSMPASGHMAAVGCILDVVYVICGFSTASNEAYNIRNKQWSKIAPCPVTWHQNSGGVILNKICITAYTENNAYIYDPTTNQYSAQIRIPGNNFKPVGHGYILTNQCMFQVQGNDTGNWKTIQYTNGAPIFNIYHGISYLFKRGKYLYAINYVYQVWQIDTELFGAKLLVTT